MDRRSLLALAGAGVASALGCRSAPPDPRALRLGFFCNVTHAPALLGVHSGRFARALQGVRFETRVFNAGPAAMGALFAGAIDVLYAGPVPVVTGFVRTRGRGLAVVSGAASGGSLLMVRGDRSRGVKVRCAEELRGRLVATPQLGNSQDLALRGWLRRNGMSSVEYGGDVRVSPMSNASVLQQFRRGALDAAWVPEPWAARLEAEADARVLIDERELWLGRRFAATVLAARGDYVTAARENVARVVAAHRDEVERLRAEPRAKAEVNAALRAISGRALPGAVLERAWGRVEFTTDPLEETIRATARVGQALALVPQGEVRGLVRAL